MGFESWLERDQVLHLDFDPSVVGIASQPFWLHWTDEAGKPVSTSSIHPCRPPCTASTPMWLALVSCRSGVMRRREAAG